MMKEVSVESLQLNPMMMLGHEWMLLTAGKEENFNTMTVAWGHMGVIWNRPGNKRPCHYIPTVCVYVRPQRYTKAFVDREELFTLCVKLISVKKLLEDPDLQAQLRAEAAEQGAEAAEA